MKKILTSVGLVTLLASSCLMAELLTTAHAASPDSTQPEKTQHSQKVIIGKLFTITLPANPTTGYSWILRTLPAPVSFVSVNYRQSVECKTAMPGCGGEQVFTFRAEKTGKGMIELVYGRPWEEERVRAWSEQVEISAFLPNKS